MKHRFFRHLLGGDDADAERVYRWHIAIRVNPRWVLGLPMDRWKRTLDDYVRSANVLLASMSCDGFLPRGAIPLDPDGELLDGAHRLACALALGIDRVPVLHWSQQAWAPAWGRQWFVEAGMAPDDLERLERDWRELTGD